MDTEPDRLDRYAVVGNPIGHSKSPRIHALFAAQTGQAMQYSAMLVEMGDFAQAVDRFRAAGGKGLNITLPFKPDAWAYADTRSARAERAGAVNTLAFHAGQAFGETTDGPGLVRDLTVNHSITLAGQRILILGAGGAARGVLQDLLAQRPAHLTVANRTPAKAHELARRFADLGPVTGCGFPELAGSRFDVVVNATAAGLDNAVPPLPDDSLAPGACCYDMLYSDQPTTFVRWALAHGAAWALDGLGMLLEQAAESFFIWRGVRPEIRSVLAVLRPS